MKKVLLASTALVLSAQYAAAEVEVSGDGRMGVVYEEQRADDSEISFNSRLRIKFSASGETDGGLQFGGSVRADNAAPTSIASTITDAEGRSPGDLGFDPNTVQVGNENSGGGANGLAGTVFVSGAYGKLTMGDIDSAAENAIGDVSGVGYTGIGDLNETAYIAGGDDEGALYEYTFDAFSVYASLGQPSANMTSTGDSQEYALGFKYTMGNYSAALGYENVSGDDNSLGDNFLISGTAAFGDATIKAVFSSSDLDSGIDTDQYAVSLDYVFGATTVTGFYRGVDQDAGIDTDAFGIGASYDLGGGAALVGGIVNIDNDADLVGDDDDSSSNTRADFGISMTF